MNTTPITIADNGAASPYPSTISVSGLSGNATDVNVTLNGFTHTWPDDVDVLLVGPAGQQVLLMSDVGGYFEVSGLNLTLDDAAATALPDDGPLTSGTFQPTNIGTGDAFPAPAPASPYDAALASFNATDPNGTWSLYVYDDTGGDSGSISGGWSLEITVGPDTTPPTVRGRNPAPSAALNSTSVNIDVTFSEAVQGVDATDLVLSGTAAVSAATGVPTKTSGNTWRFPVSGLVEGALNVSLAPDANDIEDLAGNDLANVLWSYTVDTTAPRVVSSSVQANDVRAVGNLTYTAQFSEPLNTASLEMTDLQLVGQVSGAVLASTFTYDGSTQTVTAQFAGLGDDLYTLKLLSGNGKFEDAAGNALDGEVTTWPIPPNPSGNGTPGGDFAVPFEVDLTTTSFPTPFQLVAPLGSLIYRSTAVSGAIAGSVDTDAYTVSLDAGQRISVLANAFSGLDLALELRDPSGAVVATANAMGVDQDEVLSSVGPTVAGVYTVTVSDAAGTIGGYQVELLLNAAVELESHQGPGNDNLAMAQDLSGAFVALGGTAERAAVLGISDRTGGSYQASAVPFAFEDISATGNRVLVGVDDGIDTLDDAELGDFQFPFYGTTYSSLFVSSNGLITFGTGNGSLSNTDLTSLPTQAAIAVLWDDLDTRNGVATTGVYWEVRGSGSAQRLILQWNQIQYYFATSGGDTITFQAVLSAADGSIRLNYQDLTSTVQTLQTEGKSATVGIKDAGTQGFNRLLLLQDNGPNAYVASGVSTLMTWTPPVPPHDWYQFNLDAGETATLTLTALGAGQLDLVLSDASGASLARGVGAQNVAQIVSNFVAPVAAAYYADVGGTGGDYSLVVIRNADFDTEPNNDFTGAQEISGIGGVLGHVKNAAPGPSQAFNLLRGGTVPFVGPTVAAYNLPPMASVVLPYSVGPSYDDGPAPAADSGKASPAAPAAAASSLLPTIDQFPGPGATGFIPPDPSAAAGPEQIVTFVNCDIAIYDKSTGAQLFQDTSTNFFSSVGSTADIFDPWVLFDTASQRFYLIGIDIASDTQSNVFLAVSTDATPTGAADWYKYKIDFTHDGSGGLGSGAHFPDYPKLGVNQDAVWISGNYFPITGGSGVYAGITAIDKAALLTGGPATKLYDEYFNGFSVFPLTQYGPSAVEYFAEANTGSGSAVTIHAVTNVLTSPTRTTATVTVPPYLFPDEVPQLGGGAPADAIDARIMTGVWQNGSMWFAHAVKDPAIGDGEAVARWYEVATNNFPAGTPALVQSGNVDPGPGVHAWMPAIAVDANDNMGLGFSIGGPTQYFGAGFTGRLAGDPAGTTISPVTTYASGLASYVALDGSGRNRWGDYSGLSIDPADRATFWAFNEYATGTPNTWATTVASFVLQEPSDDDWFTFQVNVGDTLTLQTSTPVDGANEFVNTLDPRIELYAPDGSLVAADDNSAPDGRNALLIGTAAQTGSYRVKVSAVNSRGEYFLSVETSSALPGPSPSVVDMDPDNGQMVPVFPTTVALDFSESLLLSSVQAADVLIGGLPALGLTVEDGDTIRFQVDPAANAGDTTYLVQLAAGAVADLQGRPNAAFTGSFMLDSTGPRIVATTWNGGALPGDRVLAEGPLTFTARLNEDLYVVGSARRGPFTPAADDIRLVDTITGTAYAPATVSYDPATDLFTATYAALPEGNYVLTLLSGNGSFEDLVGNDLDGEPLGPGVDGTPSGNGVAGGNYVVTFSVDRVAPVAAQPFTRLEPLGGLMSLSTGNTGLINGVSDEDDFTFFVAAGETILVTAAPHDPAATLAIQVPGFTGVFSAAAPGGTAILPLHPIAADGVYALRVTSDLSTTFTLEIHKNFDQELTDTDASHVLPFDATHVALPPGGRYAVVGSSAPIIPPSTEWIVNGSFETGTLTGWTATNTESDAWVINNGSLDPTGPTTPQTAIAGSFDAVVIQSGPGIQRLFQSLVLPTGIVSATLDWSDRIFNQAAAYADPTHEFRVLLLDSGDTVIQEIFSTNPGDPLLQPGPNSRSFDVTALLQTHEGQIVQLAFEVQDSLYFFNVYVDNVSLGIATGTIVPDVDDYSLDLTASVGHTVDLVLTGLQGVDFSGQTLELVDPDGVVVATASQAPLGVDAANYDLGIRGFSVADPGVYTLQVTSGKAGDYSLVLTDRLAFDSEPNDNTSDPLRSLNGVDGALGYLNSQFLTLFTDRASFNSANPGLPIEDFEEAAVAAGDVAIGAGPLRNDLANALFDGGEILPGISIESDRADHPLDELVALGAGFLGNASKVVGPGRFAENTQVDFPNGDVYAVGLDILADVASSVNVTVFGPAGVILTTAVVNATPIGVFFGVAASDPITRILLGSTNGDLIDNVAFGPLSGSWQFTTSPTAGSPATAVSAAAGTAWEPDALAAADSNRVESYQALAELRQATASPEKHTPSFYLPPQQQLLRYDGFLSGPSYAKPLTVAMDFLTAHARELGLQAQDLAGAIVTDKYVDSPTGVTHIYLRQAYNGLEVANAEINVNVTAAGQVINVGSSFVPGLGAVHKQYAAQPVWSAGRALAALGDQFGWTIQSTPAVLSAAYGTDRSQMLAASGVSLADIPAKLHYVPTAGGGVELAWQLIVQTVDGDHWYDASVSAADGQLLNLADWVDQASYNVFPLPLESPSHGSRSIQVNPHDSFASPYGWQDTDGVSGAEFTDTRGNNVSAQEDRDNNNTDGHRPDGTASLTFNFPLDLAQAPTVYEDASITNLFYWNNILHDVHYQYGFTEAAGNFQVNNYGHGGAGNDAVQADAQDGSGTNNANFSTPPDGFAPRMQQYIFTQTTPNRDSSLDSGIVVHEYGHGVSNRLTGGPANANALNALQSGAMGEGWSDWWALMFTQVVGDQATDAYPMGTYVLGQNPVTGSGIRRHPYSFDMAIEPLTFGDFNTSSEVHDAGEIWAATLWDLNWLLIQGHTLDPALPAGLGFDPDLYHGTGGNNLALQLIMDGLKLQPANPSFLDGRDAILLADRVNYGGAHQLAIWKAFARRGMGYSASDGGNANATTVVQAFDLPAASRGTVEFDRESYQVGDTVSIRLRDMDLVGGGPVSLDVVTNRGDVETVTLAELGAGVFAGSVSTAASAVNSRNGVLEVAVGDRLTVTYQDADDGLGKRAVVVDQATMITLVDVFNVDFSDSAGAPFDEGFSLSGSADEWHLSTGRGTQAGHTVDDSFYFGIGEGSNGGGSYANSAQGTLTSPVIDLRGYLGGQLSFNHFLQTESGFDFATVRIRTSAGTTLLASSDAELPAATSGFEHVTLDLAAFAGQLIQIEFGFASDFSVTSEGWYVDDVTVRGGITAPALMGPTVVSIDPSGTVVNLPISQVVVAFSEPITAASAIDPANYEFVEAGPDDVFGTADDVPISFAPSFNGTNTVTLLINSPFAPLAAGSYQLTIDGDSSIEDLDGNPLNSVTGPGGGADHVHPFHVAIELPPRGDLYTLDLAADQSIWIWTETPFDAPAGCPVNDLDPQLFVYSPAGFPLAADQNSRDGKNAQIEFTAPVAGTYLIQVVSESGVGEYLLRFGASAMLATPVATADAITVGEGGTAAVLVGGATSVLSNDTDADLPNDTLTVNRTPVVGPLHGTLTLNADGTFSYTHDGTENLADSFTYEVSDAANHQAQAVVSITVTPVNDNTPTATADAITVGEGGTAAVLVGGATSVLANDTDADLPHDTLTVNMTPVVGPLHGTLTLKADGTFSYTHDGTENLTDSFTYEVSDAANHQAQAVVSITVTLVNDNTPVATADAITVGEGGTATVLVGGATSVLANDTDADLPHDTLTVNMTPVVGPLHGTLTLNADGTFSYTHDGTENLTDSFTYDVSDAANHQAQAVVSITVTPVNDNTPTATADAITVGEGGTA
ncbi:MAG: M36 family metallopeptidase, partial [Planctomycetota bacterium]|nr:M36 family metallopeptidase [Planctomycetota bacterium]